MSARTDDHLRTVHDTLADLAATTAGASRVFARRRLDFCCAGRRTLEDACAERDLDPDAVLAEIAAEAKTAAPVERWDERPIDALIEHLLDRYHDGHRREVPRLVEMARKVEEVHAERADVPRGLFAHLVRMGHELEEHMQKEEQILFPLIRSGRGAMAHAPIQVMEMEHDAHGQNLRRMRELAHDFAPPPDACGTWKALYLGLAELEEELMRHVHLENHVLFPRALNS